MKTTLINTQQASEKYNIKGSKVNRIVRKEDVPYDVIGKRRPDWPDPYNQPNYIFSAKEFEKAFKNTFKSKTQRKQPSSHKEDASVGAQ